MKRDIHLKWFYPKPVSEIWLCLTDPDVLKQWSRLHRTNAFKAEVGFTWMETQKPRRGWDGKMYFKVLEVVPQKRLSYSFKGGPNPSEMTLDTVVTWELVPKKDGTELHLTHTGFKGIKGAITSFIMSKGWNKQITKYLAEYFNNSAHASIRL
jgi:uncharacterized protein YndB with AHSA1/START domain